MAEESGEEIPRRMRRFYRKPAQGESQGQEDVFSKPLPSAREERRFEPVPEEEREEQAETIYREQEAEEKEIDWDRKRKEELEKMKNDLTTRKVQEFRERHHRLPEGSEEEEIAQSVFQQLQKEEERLKEEEREKRAQGRKPREEKASAGSAGFRRGQEKRQAESRLEAGMETEAAGEGIEIKGKEMLDLLKDEPEKKEKPKAKDGEKSEEGEGELGELEEVEGGEEGEEGSAGGEGKSCPNCGKEVESTVFCPECGAEFCSNCVPPKEIAGKLKYKCPKCGNEFTKSK